MDSQMNQLIETMVATCDRLLLLLTGRHASRDVTDHEAAMEAIELMTALESCLRINAAAPLPPLAEDALANLKHRQRVLDMVGDVLAELTRQGYLPESAEV